MRLALALLALGCASTPTPTASPQCEAPPRPTRGNNVYGDADRPAGRTPPAATR